MFDLKHSAVVHTKIRRGTGQWIAEAVAAAGLRCPHMEEQLITIKFVLPDASVAKASP
ncbi:hypothetical protein RPSD_02370 [Ralstonia solanacearum]|nr:hypothetical protein RPSD_02370 [Ralstonia solanacearum]